MHKTLVVLPTTRAIRERFLQSSYTLDLPTYISASEFFKNLLFVKDLRCVDEDERILLLHRSSNFKEFADLRLDRNFLRFSRDIKGVVSLFSELSSEFKTLDDLASFDLYDEYTLHIEALKKLQANYQKLCLTHGVYDPIYLPSQGTFNTSFINNYDSLVFVLEGYMSGFEQSLLRRVSELIPTTLELKTTRFNRKMWFGQLDLREDNFYRIDLSSNTILEATPLKPNVNIKSYAFSSRYLQVAFIKQKIYEFVKKGYEPSKIAVVVSDEAFVDLLEDENLNLAMGRSYTTSHTYEVLDAYIKHANEHSQEAYHRLKRVGDERYAKFRDLYFGRFNKEAFLAFLLHFAGDEIFDEQVERFAKILSVIEPSSTKEAFGLLMLALASASIDDVGGGKIRVMGLLETRGVEFDAVIVVDFNDSFVAKPTNADLFINSYLRERTSLPTTQDRLGLQKHYYKRLFDSSCEVAISYTHDEKTLPSRLLKELRVPQASFSELSYESIIFSSKELNRLEDEQIVLEFDATSHSWSATKLKSFLECKRAFYYRYIAKLKDHQIPQDAMQDYEMGNLLHSVLKDVYAKWDRFETREDLFATISGALRSRKFSSEYDRFLVDLFALKLEAFYDSEMARFASGARVAFVEKSLESSFCGFMLEGQVDRIDEVYGTLEVLDYKSGKYPIYDEAKLGEASDFQLEFYYLLASRLGEVRRCGYYDLNSGEVVWEELLEQKLEVLKQKLAEIASQTKVDFAKCEDLQKCRFCAYKILCQRDV
ncbi:MAG: PD-(D/E)XK nuclease family protein [Sulfuricurvum sp.]